MKSLRMNDFVSSHDLQNDPRLDTEMALALDRVRIMALRMSVAWVKRTEFYFEVQKHFHRSQVKRSAETVFFRIY